MREVSISCLMLRQYYPPAAVFQNLGFLHRRLRKARGFPDESQGGRAPKPQRSIPGCVTRQSHAADPDAALPDQRTARLN